MKKVILMFGLLVPVSSFAQSYTIGWYKISGGGGTSTGGVYPVSGTIGQPDASGAMTGGNYSVTGGFWSLYAVQTPGAPLLTITYIGNQAVVSWSPSVTGWTLQTNANLATPAWGNYLGTVVNNSVTNALAQGQSVLSVEAIIQIAGIKLSSIGNQTRSGRQITRARCCLWSALVRLASKNK